MNDKKINNKIINKIMDNKIKNNTLTNNKLSDNIIKSNKITGKKIKKTIVLFLIISLVISIAYGYRKINLMIGEEIILETNKLYETTLLNSGDKYDFEITINMNNYWLCKAFCDEKIVDITKDINKNNLINDSFYFYNSKSKELSYTIEAPRGYGQSIYQYEIKCQNIPTKKCPANNNSYVRKSTLIINHKPSEEEEVIINQTLLLYDSFSKNVAFSQLNIDNTTVILYSKETSQINFPYNLKEDAIKYNTYAGILREESKKIIDYWNDDYYKTSYDILLKNYELSQELLINTSKLVNETYQTVEKHNTIAKIHKNNINSAEKIIKMIKYFPGNIEDFKEYAITSLSLININTLKMNKLENYDALLRDALLEQKNIEETFNIFEKKVLETKGDYVDIYLLDKLSCLILDCNTTHIYLNLSSLADMSQRCEIHKYIMENFLTARNLTYNNRLRDGVMYNNSINNNSINNYSLNNISFEEKIFMYYLLENLSKSLNSSNMNYGETIIDYEIIVKDKINKYKNILLTELNISEVNISEVENETGHYIVINNFIFDNNRSSNQTKYMYYFLDFEPLVKTMINISFYCNRKEEKISLDEYIVKEQQLPGFNETPDIVSINKPLQKCCLYGNCEECGINKKYPIIMLHGHSFNQKNSAYQNTEIFNFLENEMESKNYISFGIWDPLKVYIFDKNSTIMFNSIFKPTYYVSYNNVLLGNNFLESKNESIEIYANRLKNIIEDIKEKTGSKKVDIIAHSMGGLVVRRYIQEYGPEDINKFIMIGTPNKGINDRVHGICKIFGNDLECDEMHQDSEFIRKLNQNYSMPETYLIIGRGCEMQNEDSDGVVLVKNAQLDYQVKKTYYIDGNCTTTSLLHNNMLKMHEVTSIIYRIIK